MHLNMIDTVCILAEKLVGDKVPTLRELHLAYRTVLKLRSQLLGAIYEVEHYSSVGEVTAPLAVQQATGGLATNMVVLTIDEPLPTQKELTADLQEHWLELMQVAIGNAMAGTGDHYFQKAFVLIEVIAPRGSNNAQLWDTSNRAINLILNNLKGVFFHDDNLEHLAFGVVGS